jgi:hypothetical protein
MTIKLSANSGSASFDSVCLARFFLSFSLFYFAPSFSFLKENRRKVKQKEEEKRMERI